MLPPPQKKKHWGKKYLYTQRYFMRKILQNLVWGQIQNFLGGQDHSAPVEVLFNFLISDHKQTFYLTFSSQTKSKSLISLFDLRKKKRKKEEKRNSQEKYARKRKWPSIHPTRFDRQGDVCISLWALTIYLC